MKEIKRSEEIVPRDFALCHGGAGTLFCASLLDGLGSSQFAFMHSDIIPAGVSIGVHEHTSNEEIYYLISGKGILTYDGKEFEMNPGDISLCLIGHSHAFEATEESRLIVVGGARK